MDADLDDTTLVNRGRVDHVYGIQNMPRTKSNTQSPYDCVASIWDKRHGMTEPEQAQTAAFIRDVFGEKLGRTLDIGCGTGWPVTAGLVDTVRYVGIDPSTAMLNALVAKHPVVAGLHPMSWAEASRRRVLCGTRYDTVLALGGAASYLKPAELTDAVTRGKRGAVVMHYTDGGGPITDDLDPATAAESLAAATDMAADQHCVGRFTLSYLPARN